MSSRFYFGGSDDSGSDLENDASLPFPQPLDRAAFLAADFDATTFLSTLSNRFQTLDDLQTELRELSQALNKELVDLVNDNYHDFLSLGSTLRGGEEKVEEIRVGMLGFQRNIAAVKATVDARRKEVATLLEQKRAVTKDINIARSLLEIADRMDDLEERLGMRTATELNRQHGYEENPPSDESDDEEDDDDDDDDDKGVSSKLKRRVEEYLIVQLLMDKYEQHPFVRSQHERLKKVRSALQLDLETAMKQTPGDQARQETIRLRSLVDNR